MDGTLVDSMKMIMEMDRGIFGKFGLPFSKEATELMKYIPLGESAKLIKRMFDIPHTEDEVTRIMYDTMREGYNTVVTKPGALEYLRFAKESGIKLCIATATEPEIALEVSERLGIMEYMDFLVACSEVGESKEKPDVFLEAARRWGFEPSEVAVFEDGLPGARSSRGAGFTVVGVYDEPSAGGNEQPLRDVSHVYIRSFADIENKLI
ncbi:MAG: HAD family phosphatase [Clostridia bacterium]|nr:HAD family phosphatase [Clostridia bacterium]